MDSHFPLAERLRPDTLDDVVGQEHIVAPDSALRQQLSHGYLPNIILSGPPGTGKTTIARLLAKEIGAEFVELSAVTAGLPAVRKVVAAAAEALPVRTVLFIDEIHRFNKAQQDALLPHVERGTIILIGATTENPAVSVNRAVLSRATIFKLHKLRRVDLDILFDRALDNLNERRELHVIVDSEARETIITNSSRDGRVLLNWLERAIHALPPGEALLTSGTVIATAAGNQVRYDRAGDWHYNTISAYIKSMRAGDEEGALNYLAAMLAGGEDPVFIARRLLIFASEDIGPADPQASLLAHSALASCQNIGMPECRIALGHVTIYCSRAPKDRSAYDAINSAMEKIEGKGNPDVPRSLRNQDWHP